ncbi:predicted protein [Histoplasma mississippiense (nom. inval.)]|nr:predicted protein [Histoplasma mississippiense (nom. inval.)]EDN06988.1 predicted protein [Histoplasma mississippiense (nom. inval.)]
MFFSSSCSDASIRSVFTIRKSVSKLRSQYMNSSAVDEHMSLIGSSILIC